MVQGVKWKCSLHECEDISHMCITCLECHCAICVACHSPDSCEVTSVQDAIELMKISTREAIRELEKLHLQDSNEICEIMASLESQICRSAELHKSMDEKVQAAVTALELARVETHEELDEIIGYQTAQVKAYVERLEQRMVAVNELCAISPNNAVQTIQLGIRLKKLCASLMKRSCKVEARAQLNVSMSNTKLRLAALSSTVIEPIDTIKPFRRSGAARQGAEVVDNKAQFSLFEKCLISEDKETYDDLTMMAARDNNRLAQALLAILCRPGGCTGPETKFYDKEKAKVWAAQCVVWLQQRTSADCAVDMHACYCLGEFYYIGLAVQQNRTKAFDLFKLASDQGLSAAQLSLSQCYKLSIGVTRDDIASLRLLTLAVNQDNAAAQYQLGDCHQQGSLGLVKNLTQAVRYYQLAADQGHAQAQTAIWSCYVDDRWTGTSKVERVQLLKVASDEGYAPAHVKLAVMYETGQDVVIDMAEAFRYYMRGAEQGNPSAQYDVARCYANGTGVARNDEETFRFMELAAKNGQDMARYQLGIWYEDGDYVAQNIVRAIQWYSLANNEESIKAVEALRASHEFH